MVWVSLGASLAESTCMLVFQSMVHSAMLETIDGLTTEKSIRGLRRTTASWRSEG